MKDSEKEVPFTFITSKFCEDLKRINKCLYLVYGPLFLVFIYKIFKKGNKK